jgi:hypothetical protein
MLSRKAEAYHMEIKVLKKLSLLEELLFREAEYP